MASTKAFADSYDDMTFTPPHLAMIRARTLIVQGDSDPLYPVRSPLKWLKPFRLQASGLSLIAVTAPCLAKNGLNF